MCGRDRGAWAHDCGASKKLNRAATEHDCGATEHDCGAS